MHKITIHSAGKISSADVSRGTMLLDAVRSNGFEVYSPCGGNGTCGKCKVYVKDEGYVTSCLYPVEGDIEIVLPEPAEARILAAQYEHSRVLPLSPGPASGLSAKPFGVAIDLGTTTLAFHFIRLSTGSLIETHTALNPQAKYGADVISRINYCILNPHGLHTLQSELVDAINLQLSGFTEKQEISPDDIVKICICGNTTMLHILLGVNPQPLAFVPFTPVFTEEKILKAPELNLYCNPLGEVKVLPSLSAYIGADIVAGIASLAPVPAYETFLFIDVGTNGEIALITPERIYCCAAAAGPAFEGANIEHGMGALQGAINIYYGPDNFHTLGDTEPVGICGSGLIDMVASLLRSGYVSADGFMEKNFVVVPSGRSGTGTDIYISPKDIREIQLAKSAIASGINVLVKRAGLSLDQVDALYLAGGFGNYIRTENAVATGLIPYELSGKVIPVGNTSGTGAMLAVRSVSFDKVVSETLNRMSYIELSDDEDFVLQFAMNMEFPERSDV
ncbi:MAG: ASKHA domain-containing protein [Bacteroidales bacterium]